MSTIKPWQDRDTSKYTSNEIAYGVGFVPRIGQIDRGIPVSTILRDEEITELREALKVAQEETTRVTQRLVLTSHTMNGYMLERDQLQTQRDMWESMFKEVRAERDALQAKLSAIEAQEPSHYMDAMGLVYSSARAKFIGMDLPSMIALYAAPVAPYILCFKTMDVCVGVTLSWDDDANGKITLNAQPLTKEQVQPAQGELEALLEKYWELAYTEGHTGVSQGNEANKVLCNIRALLQSNADRAPLENMTDMQRMEVFNNYCTNCGCKDPWCQCWNDE